MVSLIFRGRHTLSKVIISSTTTRQHGQIRRYSNGPSHHEDEFWRRLTPFKDVPREEFMSYAWNVNNVYEYKGKGKEKKLWEFLDATVPEQVPRGGGLDGIQSRDEFCADIVSGIKSCGMSLRVMPYIMTMINWKDPANDPIFRQFVPLKSAMIDDHLQLKLDSLDEKVDSPVAGIVHRYPDKALFLPVSVCPTYCVYCTRSYGVGATVDSFTKEPLTLNRKRIEGVFAYVEKQEGLHDIVVSGGDSYYLSPKQLVEIGDRLIGMKNIERFRFASKGLAVAPQRFLDESDPWTAALIQVSNKARQAGKHMALHTHFNHPNEISWITEEASLKLFRAGVTVRNQSVLLRGVNDNTETMATLIQKLGKMGIQPYYVYQCDLVTKIEHLRTPLRTILDMEIQLLGRTAGFYTPKFVVDLPGGGGKRPAHSYISYDQKTGVSTFIAPAIPGKEGRVYKYYDPI